jgi:hypothetical protein
MDPEALGPLGKSESPHLNVRKTERPGVFLLRLSPGEGSQLRVRCAELGSAVLAVDSVLREGRVVLGGFAGNADE